MGCKAKKQNNPARLHNKSDFKFNFKLEQIMTNELKAAQRDAERYRYWRNKYSEKFGDADLTPENFDSVTDAQMLMASANELESALTQPVVAKTQPVVAKTQPVVAETQPVVAETQPVVAETQAVEAMSDALNLLEAIQSNRKARWLLDPAMDKLRAALASQATPAAQTEAV